MRIASLDFGSATSFFSDDRVGLLGAAEVKLTKALSLSSEHALAHMLLGAVQIHTNRVAEGIAECERALTLDRNCAGAHARIGSAKYFLGRGEETEAHIIEALRLSPRDTSAHVWLGIAGFAKVHIGLDDEAVYRFASLH